MDTSIFFYIIFSTFQLGLIYTLISLGFNLLYSSTRIINVAYGEFLALGSYTAFWLYTLYSIPPPATMLIIAIILAAVSYPLYLLLFKPLLETRNVEYIEVWGVIITFGLSITLQGLMTLLWSAQSKAYSYFDNVVEIGTITVTFNRLIAMIIAAFLVVLLYLLLFRTDFGVSMRSVIQDPNLASLLGLNINSIFAMAFILSSAIAGVSGVLISMTVEISPFMGVTYVILAFVITAIGGVGNPIGSLAGGLILGLLDVLIGYTVGPGLNLFIVYSLLVAILVVRPKGLLGRG